MKIIKLLIIVSIFVSLQGCQNLGSSFATSMMGTIEGKLTPAIENSDIRIGMSYSKVTSIIGKPTIFCQVRNRKSSSGSVKVWITDAKATVWANHYKLVFVNGGLNSWAEI